MTRLLKAVLLVLVCLSDNTKAGADEPVDAIVGERRERLDAHTAAFQEWANRICRLSDIEQAELAEKLSQKRQQLEDRWKRNVHRQNEPLADYAPVALTALGGAANFLRREQAGTLLEEVLSDEHQKLLFDAFDERVEEIRTAMLNFAIILVDDELFLTADQRIPLTSGLRSGNINFDDGVFTFNTRHAYFPFILLRDAVDVLPDSLLTDIQRKWLNDAFIGPEDARGPMGILGGDIGAMEELRRESAENVKAHFLAAAALRTSWLQHSVALSPQQIELVTVAGKGAALQCTLGWKERMPRHDLPGQVFVLPDTAVGRKTVMVDLLDQNEIWQQTVREVGAADAYRERAEFHRAATVDYVTAMLDKEIWLTPDQRQPLSELIDAAIPETMQGPKHHFRELELLIIPLFRIPPEDLGVVLTKAQQTAWNELRNQFDSDGKTVTFQMRNHGAIAFRLPQ